MELKLFQHNQKAYESALNLMEETGKAAVIHPTGTGKSLIAFKLALDHPAQRVIWLAPSEYIFQTQLENVRKILNGSGSFENIHFFTYSKLMMNEELIGELLPDYIVLDEFHRCGAAEWGKSVEKLLAAYPDAKILGLSATNIRYLDGQRDMAEEIFDGQIASEMTLGAAIAGNILPAPTYVVSMYSYQEAFRKLKKRTESVRNPALRKENEKLLEELKRALEHAEGLDRIFARHMEKRDGKYIVFCSDKEHMEEMQEKSREWFRRVDSEPHCYAVTYDNPETSREFAAFKADDSSHLKLLFCIDMLNEGVHVEDIDGVILLRPTVSPILYLQQIGRSLSAGKSGHPVIFDVVNNFDSLYSVDFLRKEFEEAAAVMPCTDAERKRFQDSFRIIDEVRECRQLFEQLCRNLSASWDMYYLAAKEYRKNHGDLRVTKSYVTQEGLTLGSWIQTQRRVHSGKVAGKLTQEQIEKLDLLGMEWEDGSARSWNRGYEALLSYKKEYGNVDVKATYITKDGYALGKWITNLRQNRNVTAEQKASLDALGMIWDKRGQQWDVSYRAAVTYYETHGDLRVPHNYRTDDGITLGVWIANQRSIYAGKKRGAAPLTRQREELLNNIGMIWN
jgi:superfamily II DNA or RNA helicase